MQFELRGSQVRRVQQEQQVWFELGQLVLEALLLPVEQLVLGLVLEQLGLQVQQERREQRPMELQEVVPYFLHHTNFLLEGPILPVRISISSPIPA